MLPSNLDLTSHLTAYIRLAWMDRNVCRLPVWGIGFEGCLGVDVLSQCHHICIHTHTHTYIYIYIYIYKNNRTNQEIVIEMS